MRADLHVHSTASDGTLSPSALVALAQEAGLDVLAIADHDSVAGLPEAMYAAAAAGITLVPAVELSAVEGNRDVHVLGYFVDHTDADLARYLADLRAARRRRAETMVDALRDGGYDVDLDVVLALSDGGSVGRSHVARALVDRGHAETIADAFGRLIGRGRPYYVSKDARTPSDVIAIIKAAGGLAVVAHPGVNGLDEIIPALAEAGLSGIEAYHADHTHEQRERYSAMARDMGLLVTGGTDFHGPSAPNPPLGSVDVPSLAIVELLSAGAAR